MLMERASRETRRFAVVLQNHNVTHQEQGQL